LENTLYIWKYFALNIRADSSCPPNYFALPAMRLRFWIRPVTVNFCASVEAWNELDIRKWRLQHTPVFLAGLDLISGVGAGDTAAFPSNFFKQI